jgi:CBS-domain-containing membrane protein
LNYLPLPGFTLPSDAQLANAETSVLPAEALERAAISMMTDLTKTPAVTIGEDATLKEAKAIMLRRGVRMLFVMRGQHIAGIITTTDILGEKLLKVALHSRQKHSEILVKDLMTPRDQLEVMDKREVARAKVGNLVATLQQSGRQHALVVCQDKRSTEICGIFSAADISRRLGIEIGDVRIAQTFAEIEARLLHG